MFDIGDKIVYPMHGAGTIVSIEEKEILGEKRKYYTMKMPIGDMKVMIPVDSVEEVGVRGIISGSDMEEVLEILAGEKSQMSQNWNKRYRNNMDKIKSGDICEVAWVVRNLSLMDREKGLSTGERKMLNNAKQILLSEVALVKNLNKDEAESLITESLC
jgi:CarD family transcriptional regulator